MKNYNIEWPNVPALAMEPGQTATTGNAVLPGRHNVGPKVNPVESQSLLGYATLIAAILLTLSTALAFAQPPQVHKPRFQNVVVSCWNLSEFSDLPANDDRDASGLDDSVGKTVFNWLDRTLTSIVTTATSMFSALDENYIFDTFRKIAYISNLLMEDRE